MVHPHPYPSAKAHRPNSGMHQGLGIPWVEEGSWRVRPSGSGKDLLQALKGFIGSKEGGHPDSWTCSAQEGIRGLWPGAARPSSAEEHIRPPYPLSPLWTQPEHPRSPARSCSPWDHSTHSQKRIFFPKCFLEKPWMRNLPPARAGSSPPPHTQLAQPSQPRPPPGHPGRLGHKGARACSGALRTKVVHSAPAAPGALLSAAWTFQ